MPNENGQGNLCRQDEITQIGIQPDMKASYFVSENAMTTYDITSRDSFKTFACLNPSILHANVRDFCTAASTADVFLCF